MKFKIKFVNNKRDKPITNIPERKLGINDLDYIREKLNKPNIKSKNISSSINEYIYYEEIIEIPEGIARSSNHFNTDSEITVVCKNATFDGFYDKKIIEYYQFSTNYTIQYIRNDIQIIDTWSEFGFPLHWDFQQPKPLNTMKFNNKL